MKGFYKTTALLVSLLGISNLSCGTFHGAGAIHETREGQATTTPIPNGSETQSEFSNDSAGLEGNKSEDSTVNLRVLENFLKKSKKYFKEHLGRCIGGAVVAVGIAVIIYQFAVKSSDSSPSNPAESLENSDGVSPPLPALLHAAIREGRVNDVEALIKAGVDKEARDEYGRTPLYVAVLIKFAKMDEIKIKMSTGYYLAASLYISAFKHIKIVELLLAAGAKNIDFGWHHAIEDLFCRR
ncbi:MAG: ankyrin repeat domain-containing protein [Holosporales bacterium]|jgi:ankyrin repeat protein|nr:ankyrin repeat domain-containing protein [Holosporales bacterium]